MPAPSSKVAAQVLLVRDDSHSQNLDYFKNVCTGSVVRHKNKRFFFTAAHCIAGENPEHRFSIYEGTLSQPIRLIFFSLPLFEGLKKRTVMTVGRGFLSNELDLFFAPLQDHELLHTEVLEIAPVPAAGEATHALGYAGGFGPIHVPCRNYGFALYRTLMPSDPFQGFGLYSHAICQGKNIETYSGMSGGPALSSENKFLGVNSRGAVPLERSGPNSQLGILEFVPFSAVEPIEISPGEWVPKIAQTPFQFTHEFLSRALNETVTATVEFNQRPLTLKKLKYYFSKSKQWIQVFFNQGQLSPTKIFVYNQRGVATDSLTLAPDIHELGQIDEKIFDYFGGQIETLKATPLPLTRRNF